MVESLDAGLRLPRWSGLRNLRRKAKPQPVEPEVSMSVSWPRLFYAPWLVGTTTIGNRPFHVLTCCRKNQPFLRESIRVQSETIAAVAAATHATADHEMSQREPVEEVIFAREKATRKNARLDSAIVAHSRHPVSTRGRRTLELIRLFPHNFEMSDENS